ncbi:MAG: hypothetical protein N2C14_20560, partial [Planctomycetales bacterium]
MDVRLVQPGDFAESSDPVRAFAKAARVHVLFPLYRRLPYNAFSEIWPDNQIDRANQTVWSVGGNGAGAAHSSKSAGSPLDLRIQQPS